MSRICKTFHAGSKTYYFACRTFFSFFYDENFAVQRYIFLYYNFLSSCPLSSDQGTVSYIVFSLNVPPLTTLFYPVFALANELNTGTAINMFLFVGARDHKDLDVPLLAQNS